MSDVLAFYDASGKVLTAVWGQGVTVSPQSSTPLDEVAGLAPPSTTAVAFGVIAYTSTAGAQIYVNTPNLLSSPNDPSSPPVVGPLTTSGNRILDARGNPVLLHGVVLDGLEGNPSPPDITEQAVLQAKTWEANFVRVPLGEQFWLSSSCDYSGTYAATVDRVVNWITSLGMVALLDLHYNTVACEPGFSHNMADAQQSPVFWNQVAGRYASNPLVAFDVYNEPHGISDSVWLNGGMTTDMYSYEYYQAAGMQQLYDAVRATGAKNLVFISGNNWANTVPSALVSGTNIVYAAHTYTCPVSAPPSCSTPNPYDPSSILDNWIGVSASVPVVVTEFGWPSAYEGTYNQNVISFANSHGWGWSAFAWGTQSDGPWSLVLESPTSGPFEPTPAGIPVLLGLANAG